MSVLEALQIAVVVTQTEARATGVLLIQPAGYLSSDLHRERMSKYQT